MKILKKLRSLTRKVDSNDIDNTQALDQLTEVLQELSKHNKKGIEEIVYPEEIDKIKQLKIEVPSIEKDILNLDTELSKLSI